MTEKQVQLLFQHGKMPSGQIALELIETHISWVILCKDFVFKIKKPVNLSFLDFSTLEKRKYFCDRELSLNQRLTKAIYLEVIPVSIDKGEYAIGFPAGQVVDYAVKMRRLDNSREMDTLLEKGEVHISDIQKIVRQLIHFHQHTEIVKGKLKAQVLIDDFKDILQVENFVKENVESDLSDRLTQVVAFAENFIRNNAQLISQRDVEGFTRDCHGDLHSGNIFLLDTPVMFDCIEFNDHFRQIDVLNELAFFAMDLEFAQRADLSEYFIKNYNDNFKVIRNEEEARLFLFYKLYRANVKVKVNAIKIMQSGDPEFIKSRLILFKNYFELFITYFLQLSKQEDIIKST